MFRSDECARPRGLSARILTVLAAAGCAAGLAIAHDEDWRKLADKLPPMEGPIWRQGQDNQRNLMTYQFSGVSLLSQIPLNNFGLSSTSGNDCWGYVSGSGREYAIMGLSNGYGFVEITDPVNPVIVATVSGPESTWHDVKVIGDYAYGVSEAGAGIQVMDLSDIDNGNVTHVGDVLSGGHSTSHNIVANTDSGSLWVVGSNVGNGGLVHFDISNPTNPVLDGGHTQSGYVHDAQVVTIKAGDPQAGAYLGRQIAFLAEEDAVTIADVTNPNSTSVISRVTYANSAYTHQCWLSDDRRYLYMNDELDELDGFVSTATTRVIDVTDLANPAFVSTFTTGEPSIDHNLYTHQGFIFEANYTTGLRIFDAADPVNPVEVAYFDTHPESNGMGFNGAWSCYPYFPSGTVIASDIERGLFVFAVDVLDDTRLTVGLVGDAPEMLNPAGGTTVTAEVAEVNLTLEAGGPTLVFDDGSGPQTVNPTELAGGEFEFAFPATDCFSDVTYYFEAQATNGEIFTYPAGAPTNALSAVTADSKQVDMSEDFESAPGWSVSSTATDGQWSRGVPDFGDRGDPPADFDGSGQCYLTDNVAGNSDVDNGETTLTSPVMDASTGGMLEYAYWINDVPTGILSSDDGLFVELSTNGASWTRVRSYNTALGSWRDDQIDLVAEGFDSPTLQVRFIAADLGTQGVVEAALDSLLMTSLVCEEPQDCEADFNGDGILDFFDVSLFLSNYNNQNPAADLNGDGVYDFFDVGLFTQLFSAGCP